MNSDNVTHFMIRRSFSDQLGNKKRLKDDCFTGLCLHQMSLPEQRLQNSALK